MLRGDLEAELPSPKSDEHLVNGTPMWASSIAGQASLNLPQINCPTVDYGRFFMKERCCGSADECSSGAEGHKQEREERDFRFLFRVSFPGVWFSDLEFSLSAIILTYS